MTTVKDSTRKSSLSDGTLAQIYDGSTTRLYVGDMVFTRTGTSGTPVLESAAWEGGRLINGSGTGNVLYYVTDHLGSVRAVKDGAGTIRQRYDYYPFGTVSRVYTSSSTTDYSLKRYRFGGKEIAGTSLTDLAGTGTAPGAPYLDFGARLYSPGTATWLSVDPMAEKYYGIGPLTYCAGNPGNLVDPEGRSPIYSLSGEFLGTDNGGLAGDYIIMDSGVFRQGMSHSEALENKYGGPLSKDVTEIITKHVSRLSERPDYDGYLTKREADQWWLGGTGEPLYVDQSKIDLPGITTESFSRASDGVLYKNFIWGMSETGKTYGTLGMRLVNPATGEIAIGTDGYIDEYDFSMNKGQPLRNFATWIGRPGKNGKDYKIIGYGQKTVPVKNSKSIR